MDGHNPVRRRKGGGQPSDNFRKALLTEEYVDR